MNERELLTKIFNDYADLNGIIFGHGFSYYLNQKENEGNNNVINKFIYLYEPKPMPEAIKPYGFDWSLFRVNIFIGMNSDPKEQFYKANKGVSDTTGYKFDKYIVPSFDLMTNFVNTMSNCNDVEFTIISIDEMENYQDGNLDGYLISASVRLYNKS